MRVERAQEPRRRKSTPDESSVMRKLGICGVLWDSSDNLIALWAVPKLPAL